MTDLVAFLRARLDEDQAATEAASGSEWTVDGTIIYGHPLDQVVDYVYDDNAEHIARHDPVRVLREVEAKRRILNEHRPVRFTDVSLGIRDAWVCRVCHGVLDEPEDWPADEVWAFPNVQLAYPCLTVRLTLLPFDQHPDYHEEWRP